MFTLTINTDGAAFEDDPELEVARILAAAAENLSTGFIANAAVRDINGNTVGRWILEV